MKIFYTCPTDMMLVRLHHQFGEQISCYQNLGGLFNFHQSIWADSLYLECSNEAVSDVYFVGSTQNKFLNSVLQNEIGYGSHAEQAFAHLYVANFEELEAKESLQEKKFYLLMQAYKKQRKQLMAQPQLRQIIQDRNININALILMNNEFYRFELLETIKR